jgi:hypothetical protein
MNEKMTKESWNIKEGLKERIQRSQMFNENVWKPRRFGLEREWWKGVLRFQKH